MWWRARSWDELPGARALSSDYVIRVLLEARDRLSEALRDANRRLQESLRGTRRESDAVARSMAGMSATMGDSDRRGNALTRTMRALGRAMRGTGFDARFLSGSLRGIIIVAVIQFIQPLITALVALAAQLVAVASSAGLAAAALGSALVAAIAQAIPAVALLVAAFTRVKQVMEAVKASQQAQEQASEDQTSAMRRAEAAAERVRSAMLALADANRALTDAQRFARESQQRLTDARREATRQLHDMVMTEREARLEALGAQLSVEEAQRRLNELIATGAEAGEIARAQLTLREARLGRDQARTQLGRQRADTAEARAEGIEGSDLMLEARKQLAQSNRQVADAERRVAEATRDLSRAQRDAAKDANALSSSQRNLVQELAELSPAERRLFAAMQRIKRTWREQWRGITDVIIDSFTRVIDRVDAMLRDPRNQAIGRRLAQGIATGIDNFFGRAFGQEGQGIMRFLGAEAARNAPIVGRAMGDIAIAVGKLAQAASPLLRDIIDGFASWADSISRLPQERFDRFMRSASEHLDAWWELARAVGRLFLTLGGAAAEEGESSVRAVADELDRWSDWIEENEDRVRDFFHETGDVVRDLWSIVASLSRAVVSLFDPSSTRPLAQVITQILVPALVTAIDLVGFLQTTWLQLLTVPVVSTFAKWFAAFGILFGLMVIVRTTMVAAFLLLWRTLMAHPFVALIAVILLLESKFHFIEQTLKWLRARWDEDWGGIRSTVERFGRWLDGVFLPYIRREIREFVDDVKMLWGLFERYILDPAVRIFNFFRRWGVFDFLIERFRLAVDTIRNIFELFKNVFTGNWSGAWNNLKNIFGNVWNSMLDTMATVINQMLNGWNKLVKFLPLPGGVEKKLLVDWRWRREGAAGWERGSDGERDVPGRAEGGIVQPVPGGVYRVAEAGHPEAVIPFDPRHRGRALAILRDTMVALGLAPGFQAGGIAVPPVPGILAAARDPLAKTILLGQWMQSVGFRVGEHPSFGGVLARHAGYGTDWRSYHYSRQGALDVNRDGPTEMAWLDALHSALIRARGMLDIGELLWRVEDHFNHLHVALGARSSGGGRGIISRVTGGVRGVLGIGADALRRLFNRFVPGIDTEWPLLQGVASGVRGKLWDVVKGVFDDGGVVPGRGPQLIVAHGGETILPTHRVPGFQGGGRVIPIGLGRAEGAESTDIIGRGQGVISNRLREGLSRVIAKVVPTAEQVAEQVRNWLQGLTSQLEQNATQIDRMKRESVLRIKQAVFRIIDGRAVRAITDAATVLSMELQGAMEEYGNLLGRQGIIQSQLAELRARLDTTSGDARQQVQAQINALEAELLNVNEAISANVQQQVELQEQIRGALLEAINARAQRGLRRADIRARLAELRGDVAGQRAAMEERGTTLQQQRRELEELLASATNPEEIESLRDQLLENELAIAENTEALENLDGTLQPQTWSSRAWQWFRTAVFTGVGELLPQYQVPAMQTGGLVTQSGLFQLHAGEFVRPAGGGDQNVNVNITEPLQVADPTHLANRIGWELKGLGR